MYEYTHQQTNSVCVSVGLRGRAPSTFVHATMVLLRMIEINSMILFSVSSVRYGDGNKQQETSIRIRSSYLHLQNLEGTSRNHFLPSMVVQNQSRFSKPQKSIQVDLMRFEVPILSSVNRFFCSFLNFRSRTLF